MTLGKAMEGREGAQGRGRRMGDGVAWEVAEVVGCPRRGRLAAGVWEALAFPAVWRNVLDSGELGLESSP